MFCCPKSGEFRSSRKSDQKCPPLEDAEKKKGKKRGGNHKTVIAAAAAFSLLSGRQSTCNPFPPKKNPFIPL